MKKLVVAILAFLYISTSAGATVQMHYCMGKMVDWSFGHDDGKNACNNCGMENDGEGRNGCCKDEQKQLKIEKDQKVSESIQLSLSIAISLPVSYIPITFDPHSSRSEEYPLGNAPPQSAVCPVYIRNCTFRI